MIENGWMEGLLPLLRHLKNINKTQMKDKGRGEKEESDNKRLIVKSNSEQQ